MRYLHTMVRISDVDASLHFYCELLGLEVAKTIENEKGRFTIYFLSTLPSKVFVSDVVLIVGMALVISFLATLYPAYKASKANPAEILRYE